jgi:hypothetical protein
MNNTVYNTNDKKIAYVLSYMTKGAAQNWVANFLDVRQDDDGTYDFPTFDVFIVMLNNDFKDVEAKTKAHLTLKDVKQDGEPIEQFNTKFNQLVLQSGTNNARQDEGPLFYQYLQSLDSGLLTKVLEKKPQNLGQAMDEAQSANLQYRLIQGFKGVTEKHQRTKDTEKSESKPRRFFKFRTKGSGRDKKHRSVRVMAEDSDEEVSSDSEEEDTDMEVDVINIKDVRCFNCQMMGHFARDCKLRPKDDRKDQKFKKKTAKDVITDVRALNSEEQEQLISALEESGF